ncbi:MAG: hypothetical protein ACOZIN_08575 [Myxococcota bacterium]
MFGLLFGDKGLKLSAALVAVAVAVQALTPPHTIAHQVAGYIIGAGAVLGVASTTGREPRS